MHEERSTDKKDSGRALGRSRRRYDSASRKNEEEEDDAFEERLLDLQHIIDDAKDERRQRQQHHYYSQEVGTKRQNQEAVAGRSSPSPLLPRLKTPKQQGRPTGSIPPASFEAPPRKTTPALPPSQVVERWRKKGGETETGARRGSSSTDDGSSHGDHLRTPGSGPNSWASSSSLRTSTSTAQEKEDDGTRYSSLHFPHRLHEMLEMAETQGFSDIVSWLPPAGGPSSFASVTTFQDVLTYYDMVAAGAAPLRENEQGVAFKVHKPEEFVKDIMPRFFFHQTKFKSFRRQINLWSFERIKSGPNTGGYRHPDFIRSDPSRCAYMKRSKIKRPPLLLQSGGAGRIDDVADRKEGLGIIKESRREEGQKERQKTGDEKCFADYQQQVLTRRSNDPTSWYSVPISPPPSRFPSWYRNHEVSLLNYAYDALHLPHTGEGGGKDREAAAMSGHSSRDSSSRRGDERGVQRNVIHQVVDGRLLQGRSVNEATEKRDNSSRTEREDTEGKDEDGITNELIISTFLGPRGGAGPY